MMGGRIWAESKPGAGTTFYFNIRLPLAMQLPADGGAPAVIPKEPGTPLRILLVEDNIANQKLANYIFRDRGHVVEIAGDGKEAIRLAEQFRYDVILMDVQMPEMDGLDATEAIRNLENGGRRVPIIAMTAHAMQSDRDRCVAVGMDGYLCKPVKREELIETIEQLAAKGAGREPPGKLPPDRDAPSPANCNSESALADSSAFNLNEALARLDGNFALFREMADFLFGDALTLLPAIRAAVASGDAPAMERTAHRLKGTVLSLVRQGRRRGRQSRRVARPLGLPRRRRRGDPNTGGGNGTS